MRTLQPHYDQGQLAVLLGNRAVKTVLRDIRAGKFGPPASMEQPDGWFQDGGTFFVPLSGVDYYRTTACAPKVVDLEPHKLRQRAGRFCAPPAKGELSAA